MRTLGRLSVVLATMMVAAVVGVTVAQQQEAASGSSGGNPEGSESKTRLMTHGELAQILVRKLGLYRLLPVNPTDMECMILLAQNGIFPSPTLKPTEQNPVPGWSLDPEREVTLADLAVLLVRALRLEGSVQGDPADPQNWLNVLKDVQVPTDSIGAGVAALVPLSDVVEARPIFQVTQDPIQRRYIPEPTTIQLLNTLVFPDLRPPTVPPAGPPPVPVTPT
jgi:microcompartment protein CcmK/EutM